MLNSTDLKQLTAKGISWEQAEKQLENFKKGFPFLKIIAPATPERGILILTEEEKKTAVEEYENSPEITLSKFVPASGAASRMFKDLYGAMSEICCGKSVDENSEGGIFIKNIQKFAFYSDLLFKDKTDLEVLENTLTSSGLNYGIKPKGEILFHRYREILTTDANNGKNNLPEKSYSRTAFEEHLVEGALYAKRKDKSVNIVFSVSNEHLEDFRNLFYCVKDKYESLYGVCYNVSFTLQEPSTDILAVDCNNDPFRKEDGSILFRPAGHGALIENLGKIGSEIVIIKNIDNVIHESRIHETVLWKKILTGRLLQSRKKTFDYLKKIECIAEGNYENIISNELILEMIDFLEKEYCVRLPENILNGDRKNLINTIKRKMNRPIRVCGMVRNLGEPGGGPFVIEDKDGSSCLQILESAQINTSDHAYSNLFSSGTHFNPVDIVCSLSDYKGKKFDLKAYVDESTGFISEKTHEGKKLKAQELPGLWNGAMSNWNTVFVDVPLITFNPVKTITDLLRKEHLQ